MPQMAPLNWILLFSFFTITFLILSMLNFYLFYYPIQHYSPSSTKTKLTWKW
uniref:ATP synthase F0 subunit 8 n=1 Tax=Priotyrannus closteroides TaxID=584594 RepID=UPI0020010F0A|nr:ATP synthase F0 subunit 8 [Priotyrannus closteroides]UNZ12707.1 ATP synthase F0 subunit 8 [Priotyrannus closteroides]